MHRIDGAGATTDHLFTEGDPSTGVPATTVTGGWLNAVQEEIAHVIEAAGITLSKPDNGQLYAAIVAIVSASQGFTTGDLKLTMKSTADAGWVMCNDGTIGPAGSSATTRANADCQALYTLLWNNVSNSFAAVTGGRGASAAADWAAGKTLALTKMLGRALAVSGAGSSLTARSLGQTLGAETHTLAIGEIPGHTHGVKHGNNQGLSSGGLTVAVAGASTTVQSDSAGGGGSHNNMQPTTFVNVMVKL